MTTNESALEAAKDAYVSGELDELEFERAIGELFTGVDNMMNWAKRHGIDHIDVLPELEGQTTYL